jgi:CPA2 family monovalent cation:H+ antiporter-2
MNPQTVRRERSFGLDIHYGDCTRAAVLGHAGIDRARAYVIAISDPASTRRSVRVARELAPDVRIFVRTEYVSEVDELKALGADEVIPEEFETALSLFERVLGIYDVPEDTIDELADRMRLENYGFLRAVPRRHRGPGGDADLGSCHVAPASAAAGRTIGGLGVRSATGATVIAVRRAGRTHSNPGPEFVLEAGDEVSLVGSAEQQSAARQLFAPPV